MEKEFNIKINASIDAINASKNIRELKKNILELKKISEELDIGSEEFKRVNEAISIGSAKIADFKDKTEELSLKIKSIKGDSLERINNSFEILKKSILNLDFNKAKIGLDGLLNSFSPLDSNGKVITGINGIKGAFNSLTGVIKNVSISFINLAKTIISNPLFILASIISAIIAVIGILLEKLGIMKIIFDNINKVINSVTDSFGKLTDWIGITDNAGEKYAKNELERLSKKRDEINKEYDLRIDIYNKIKNLTEDEIKLIEKKFNIEISNIKNINELYIEKLNKENEILIAEKNALMRKKKLNDEDRKNIEEYNEKIRKNYDDILKYKIANEVEILNVKKEIDKKIRELSIENIKDDRKRDIERIRFRKENDLKMLENEFQYLEKSAENTKRYEKLKNEIIEKYRNEEIRINEKYNKEIVNNRIKSYNDMYDKLKKTYEGMIISVKGDIKKEIDIELELIEKSVDFLNNNYKKMGLTEEEYTRQLNILSNRKKELNERLNVYNNERILLEKEIEVLESKGVDRIKKRIEYLELEKELMMNNTDDELKRKKIELEYNEKINNERNELIKIEKELNELFINNNIEQLEHLQNMKDNEYIYLYDIYNEKIKLLDLLREKELENRDITEKEKLIINERYKRMTEELYKEMYDKINEYEREKFNESVNLYNKTLNAFTSLTDAIFAIKKSRIERGTREDINAAKKEFNIRKAIGISGTIISTLEGVVNALSAKSVIPEPFGMILKAANAAAIGIAGAANIAKISAQKFDGGGSLSPSIPSVSTSNSGMENVNTYIPPVFYNISGNNNNNNNWMKVYVVESDITSTQRRVKVIEERSRL